MFRPNNSLDAVKLTFLRYDHACRMQERGNTGPETRRRAYPLANRPPPAENESLMAKNIYRRVGYS